jgi:hypothetical protein
MAKLKCLAIRPFYFQLSLLSRTIIRMSWCNVLPHPGLLPKEKVNRSPSDENLGNWIGRTVVRKTKNVHWYVLSWGERKQVRASVKTNSTF